MNKKAVLIGAVLFAAGLLLLLSATSLGVGAASRAIQANGGSMDTEKYFFIMKSTTLSCQIGGAGCALTGSLCGVFLGRGNRG